jgi:hypothetical protein
MSLNKAEIFMKCLGRRGGLGNGIVSAREPGLPDFLAQHTKTGKHQVTIKYTKWPKNTPNDRKQTKKMTIEYTKIFHCNTCQKLPRLGFLI